MDRREMMQSGLALSLAAASGMGLAEEAKSTGTPASHHHGGKYSAVAHSAADCSHTGQICLTHCHVMLAEGEKAMAACAASVVELIATCDALMKLAASDSKYLQKMAALSLEVCTDCEKECRKHEKKHAVCKDCADACAACAKECKAIAA